MPLIEAIEPLTSPKLAVSLLPSIASFITFSFEMVEARASRNLASPRFMHWIVLVEDIGLYSERRIARKPQVSHREGNFRGSPLELPPGISPLISARLHHS